MFNSNNGYSLADIAAATGSNSRNNSGDGVWGDGAWWIIILFLFCFNGGAWGNGGFGGNGGGGTLTRSELTEDMNFADIDRGIRGLQNGICDGFYAMNTGILNGFAGVNSALSGLGAQTQQGFNSTNVALMQGQNALATQLASCCCDTRSDIKQVSYDNLVGQNAIATQIASCCCDTGRAIERGFADTNYNMATQQNALQTTIHDITRDLLDNQNANTKAIMDYLCQEKISTLQAENQNLRLAASQAAQNNYLIEQLAAKQPVPAYTVPNPYVSYGILSNCGCGC